MEELLSSLRVHEIELNEEEPTKKNKSIALKANKATSSKALQAREDFEDGSSNSDASYPKIFKECGERKEGSGSTSRRRTTTTTKKTKVKTKLLAMNATNLVTID